MERVIIAGDGLTLTLGVDDYERQDARGDDANWLRGQIELELTGAVASSFRARCSVAWTTDDLVRFHESLRTLLDDLTGTARLTTLEDQIELRETNWNRFAPERATAVSMRRRTHG